MLKVGLPALLYRPIGLHSCIKLGLFACFDDRGLLRGKLELRIVILPLRKRLLRPSFLRAVPRVIIGTGPRDFKSSRASISLRSSRAEERSRIASKTEAPEPYPMGLELELSPR